MTELSFEPRQSGFSICGSNHQINSLSKYYLDVAFVENKRLEKRRYKRYIQPLVKSRRLLIWTVRNEKRHRKQGGVERIQAMVLEGTGQESYCCHFQAVYFQNGTSHLQASICSSANKFNDIPHRVADKMRCCLRPVLHAIPLIP